MATQTIKELSTKILDETILRCDNKTCRDNLRAHGTDFIEALINQAVKDWWGELDDRGDLNTTYEGLVRKEILKKDGGIENKNV